MQTITSLSNAKIKFFKTLKTKKGRNESGMFLLEGKRAVLDALDKNIEFSCILVTEEFDYVSADCEIITVSQNIIEALSDVLAPEGIIAVVKKTDTEFSCEKLDGDCIVYLDRLQDAGNLGTIIRTCDAAGVKTVVLSKETVELFNPKTVRATMSSIFNVKVLCADENSLAEIKNQGYSLIAATLDGKNFYESEFPKKVCLIIGNEGRGVSEKVLGECDGKITLPMRGGAESLNASVAAGILIYGLTIERRQ